MLLLAMVAVYLAGLETITRLGFAHISRTQGRILRDLSAAASLQHTMPGDRPGILVVGNSLLLEGVDRSLLQQTLTPKYVATLLPIENTQFEDWYFGLKRLFGEGSRPAVVVVCLSTRQMMSRTTDGEYFARHLMRGGDLLEVKQESQLDNTLTSNYFFANQSEWLGSRPQIKNWLLQEIMPNAEELIGFFPGKTPPMPPPQEVVGRVVPHLRMLKQLCETINARLLVIVPPSLGLREAQEEVQRAAGAESISVLIPMPAGEARPNDFRDGFHLNQRGAARFTERFATVILETLKSPLRTPFGEETANSGCRPEVTGC